MLGTVPKLKEMGIKWATLDDRWFDTYGDWHPRPETFPGDSIKKMVDDFHKQGISGATLVAAARASRTEKARWESHKYLVAEVVKQHPEWLILDKNGKHGRMTRESGGALSGRSRSAGVLQEADGEIYREWGFDGSKLDNIYTVPMCYNPAHHHKSPQDSVNAVADVYKTIFQTTRAFKPESVTQSLSLRYAAVAGLAAVYGPGGHG